MNKDNGLFININNEKVNFNNGKFNELEKPMSEMQSNEKTASSSYQGIERKGENIEKSLRNYAKVFLEAKELIENEKNYQRKAFAAYDISSKIQFF